MRAGQAGGGRRPIADEVASGTFTSLNMSDTMFFLLLLVTLSQASHAGRAAIHFCISGWLATCVMTALMSG